MEKNEMVSDQWIAISATKNHTWLEYCSRLLQSSKRFLDKRKGVYNSATTSSMDKNQSIMFANVLLITDDHLPCRFAKGQKHDCPDVKVTNFLDARKVFLVGKKSGASIAASNDKENISCDLSVVKKVSKLFSALAFFEGEEFLRENTCGRMAKMHKRRITMIKAAVAKGQGNKMEQK